MVVDVTYIPEEISSLSRKNNPSMHIVVDIFRASSSMVTMLSLGAVAVIPFLRFEEAFDYNVKQGATDMLLIGEREGKPIPNFHFGNSPLDYQANRERFKGKMVCFSTTNGTRVMQALKEEQKVIVSSFLNLQASINRVLSEKPQSLLIHLAGSDGRVSMEDTLFAGYFISELEQRTDLKLYDGAKLVAGFVRSLVTDKKNSLRNAVISQAKQTAHAKYLSKIGFEKDLDFCLQNDVYDIIPVWNAQSGFFTGEYYDR